MFRLFCNSFHDSVNSFRFESSIVCRTKWLRGKQIFPSVFILVRTSLKNQMWRWLHSLPRVVRQQFHGSGASAGVHVEDHHDVGNANGIDKENWCRWKSHCKQKQRSNKENNDKHKPEFNEFWRSVQAQEAFVDAVGMGGVMALGIEIGRHKCLQKTYHRIELNAKEKFFPSTVANALPTTKSSTSKTKSVIGDVQTHQTDKTKAFTEHEEYVETKPTSEFPEISENITKQVESTSPPVVESLDDAFKKFNEVCKKYEAVGKGIMGSQEAQKQNYKSAAELWEQSSQLGHAKSHFNLALCYETGKGVKKDLKEAVRLYRLAAEDLHPAAMYNLGMMYLEGSSHTPVDTHKGLELITLAADFGLAEAQCYLGVYYASEDHENKKKSIHYLTLSANQKNVEAEYSLALCYQHGYGVDENLCKAASLFHKAAENGHSDAMYSLATFYKDGLGGLPRDVNYSEELMQQAADNGSEDAINDIQRSIKKSEDSEYKDNLQYLQGCVSSPCLTDLLRKNMITVNSTIVCDPVSDKGTLSQLYTQLLVPRGFTMTPSVTKIQQSRSPSPTNDTNKKLTRRKNGSKRDSSTVPYDNVFGDDPFDSPLSCSALERRTSTMPDLSVIPCI